MKKIIRVLGDIIGLDQEPEPIDGGLDFPENGMGINFPKNDEVLPEGNQGLKVETSFTNTQEEQKNEDEDIENCQTIFVDPKNFTDCKKIANYIKSDRMVTLNLEYLDSETAQRMMDFLMGAMLIKGASFIEISKKVYTSVPKSVKVHYDGKKNINDKVYLNIREN